MGGPSASPTVEEVRNCSFERWFPEFRDVSFPSVVIPLTQDFLEYLSSDGIRLPAQLDQDGAASDSGSSGWGDGGSDSGEEEGADKPGVQEVVERMKQAIEELGGAVLPKLNWSAPKDASWVLGGLKCQTVKDVLMLLKSSDFVAHDLCHSFDDCSDKGNAQPGPFCLVLRQWRAVNEASEFRCFVSGGRLCAVSQRQTGNFFPHLVDPNYQASLLEKLEAFFSQRLRHSFPSGRYAFDVALGKPPAERVRLVDFSPWAPATNPLMFEWEELEELASRQEEAATAAPPEFRAVLREGEGRARVENYHSIPLEVAELGATSVEEMEDLCRRAEGHLRP